jgi:hypothetical protein
VVYAKRPFGGPQAVLAYLSRYTHRVAIANSRLIACDRTGVTFRSHDHHRDVPARQLATHPSRGSPRRDQDRHIMIRLGSMQHPSGALLRRLSIGNDHTCRRVTMDNHPPDQSPLRQPGSAYRDRSIKLANRSTVSQTAAQRTSAANRRHQNPHSV